MIISLTSKITIYSCYKRCLDCFWLKFWFTLISNLCDQIFTGVNIFELLNHNHTARLRYSVRDCFNYWTFCYISHKVCPLRNFGFYTQLIQDKNSNYTRKCFKISLQMNVLCDFEKVDKVIPPRSKAQFTRGIKKCTMLNYNHMACTSCSRDVPDHSCNS